MGFYLSSSFFITINFMNISVPAPKKLMDSNPRDIKGLNPSPSPPSSRPPSVMMTSRNLLAGLRPESKASYVTPASRSVGAYMQTSHRQLVPETDEDASVYLNGHSDGAILGLRANKKKTAKGNVKKFLIMSNILFE